MCNYVAVNLALEDAYFNIHASEEDLKKFIHEKKSCLDGFNAIEMWQINKDFGVDLKRVYDEDDDYDSDDELDPDYEDAIYQHMLPLSLCDRELETEEERYLQERFEEFGDTEQTGEAEENDEKEHSAEREETEEYEADQEKAETDEAEDLGEAEEQEHSDEEDGTTAALADPEYGIDMRSADE